ncbi:MAG: porin [Alphaproteobacteria bacterium]|nr:porin [Alphaproteobacteria bacterium]MCK5554675.1 porin [Alphaproteobacteria bacterium]
MKKLLLVTTALVGVTMMSAPAVAANINLDLSGYLKFYGVYADNDEAAADSRYDAEFRRNSELHFMGETTLDNGLTVGAVTELRIADGDNSVVTDEVYGYFSGQWGRVNLGVEDGAAYLLQVAAPSADSNIDGISVSIQALDPLTNQGTLAQNDGGFADDVTTWDYQHADFEATDRLTYLTPKFNGFQAGVSYAPKNGGTSSNAAMAGDDSSALLNESENLWEVSARWDGTVQGLGIGVGAGYSTASQELAPVTGTDGVGAALATVAGEYWFNDAPSTWNVGASVAYNGFSLGASYLATDTSRAGQTIVATDLAVNVATGDVDRDTWVVGGAYDNGPYHVGASYLNQQTDYDALAIGANADNIAAGEFEVEKFTVGGGYTFGPGMTFRGAIAWGEFDAPGANDNDFTQVTVGTDIQF